MRTVAAAGGAAAIGAAEHSEAKHLCWRLGPPRIDRRSAPLAAAIAAGAAGALAAVDWKPRP